VPKLLRNTATKRRLRDGSTKKRERTSGDASCICCGCTDGFLDVGGNPIVNATFAGLVACSTSACVLAGFINPGEFPVGANVNDVPTGTFSVPFTGSNYVWSGAWTIPDSATYFAFGGDVVLCTPGTRQPQLHGTCLQVNVQCSNGYIVVDALLFTLSDTPGFVAQGIPLFHGEARYTGGSTLVLANQYTGCAGNNAPSGAIGGTVTLTFGDGTNPPDGCGFTPSGGSGSGCCTTQTAPTIPSCDYSYLQSLGSTISGTLAGMILCTFGGNMVNCVAGLNGTHTLTLSSSAPASAIVDHGAGWYFLVDEDSACCSGSTPCKAQICIYCDGIDGTTGLPQWRCGVAFPGLGTTNEVIFQFIGVAPFTGSTDWVNHTGATSCWWDHPTFDTSSAGTSCGCVDGSLGSSYLLDASPLVDSTGASLPNNVTLNLVGAGCLGQYTATITSDGGDTIVFKLWLDQVHEDWTLVVDDTAPTVGSPGIIWQGVQPCKVDPSGTLELVCGACVDPNCSVCTLTVT
jgi:hypothetical protein